MPNRKFSDEVEKLRKSQRDKEDARRAKEEHPTGFTFSLHLQGGEGTLTTRATERVESESAWGAHLEYFGFDPNEFEVDGNVIEYRCWEGPSDGGKQLYHYYKVKVRLKDFSPTTFDFEWIKKFINKKTSFLKN